MLGPIERVKLSTLEPYPGNARRGDVDAIARSLEINGQFQPVIYQKSTRYLLIGNHTHKAARKIRWAELDACALDVDDDQARKIVLAANRTGDLATYDMDSLATLLSEVDDLDGTGFNDNDLAGLLDNDNPTENESREGKRVRWGCIIYCDSEESQMELMAELIDQGHDVRAL